MTMRANEVELDFRIMEFDCSPDEITHRVGLLPTEIWYMGGTRVPGLRLTHKENGWEVSSGRSKYESFASHVDALLEHIEPHIDTIAEVGNRYHAEVSCALYLYDSNDEATPPIYLSKHAIALLHRSGAGVDFDIYILGLREETDDQNKTDSPAEYPSQQNRKEFHDISLELRITRFPCTPQEITDALGVQPTYVWHQGDPQHGDTGQLYHDNGWAITSGLPQQEEFQTHLEALLAIIEPRLDAFTDICTRYHAVLCGKIQMYYELEVSTPWIHVDKRMMRVLAQLGAEVTLHMTVSPADR